MKFKIIFEFDDLVDGREFIDRVIGSKKRDVPLNLKIEDLGLSSRIRNCLERMKIYSIEQLISTPASKFATERNFGRVSFIALKEALGKHSLKLLGEKDE